LKGWAGKFADAFVALGAALLVNLGQITFKGSTAALLSRKLEHAGMLGDDHLKSRLGHGFSGEGLLNWNGLDTSGNPTASGLYLYTVQSGKTTISQKMMVIK
jgi:hypothetical protein